MTASPRSSLRSTPLAALVAAALALWGCGGDGGGGGKGGGGGSAGKGGSGGKGGTGGSSTGTAGSSAGVAGTGGSGATAGSGGRGGTGGSSTAGTGGSATGTAGSGGSGTAGSGGSGTAGSGGSATAGSGGSATAGSGGSGTAGTGGSGTAGSGGSGTAGSGGSGTAGTGGTTPACTNGAACTLANAGGTSGTLSGVCVNGACANCAADATCQTAYGTNHICFGTGAAANCIAGDCHQHADCNGKVCSAATNFCTNCAGDADCVTAYGANHLCQGGTCVAGSCRNNADCGNNGQICNASSQCVSCNGSDAACVAAYTTGYICVSNSCVMGSCHDNSECSGGKVCNASHVCGPCTSDGQCGTAKICLGTGAAAVCVTGNCHGNNDCSNGRLCVSNSCTDCTSDGQCGSGQLCLSGGCTTGNCRDATNCSGGQICVANSCVNCSTDGECVSGYGADHLCNASGACIAGNCRVAGNCSATSQICNTSTMLCQGCTTDGQCATEYNNSRICISSVCVVGNCHTTAGSCTSGGQVCNLASHACEGCTTDSQCSDAANYGPNHICNGSGACITGNCHVAADCNNAAQVCKSNTCGMCSTNADCTTAYGANHVCSGGSCVSGNCNSSSECGNNQLCVNHSCTACTADAQCMADTTYGAMHICLGTGSNAQCVAGDCHDKSSECTAGQVCGITTPHVCGGCGGSDTVCKNDTAYGSTTICVSNACVTGDCHDTSNDCTAGQICGVSTLHKCGACASDGQCTGDTRYGSGNICYQGNCQVGNCHANSNDCTATNAGRICGVSTALVCGACSSDAQCTGDPFYGNSTICNTAAGASQGKCVSSACATNNTACAQNSGDFCCSNSCVPGNCCSNTDCANNPLFGAGYACTGNTCSHCDAIASNTYYVDPVNGDDVAATGSGKSGGAAVGACSFRTLTRAMQVIGTFAGAGTKVIIVGSGSTPRGLAASEVMPITVQKNVTVTTTGGPITIVLPAATSQTNPNNTSGFILQNDGAGVVGDSAAPLILDGNNNTSGFAVSVLGSGTMNLGNLTIQNTRAHSVSVTAATLNIGAGLVVKNAGVAGVARNGLNVSGGVVNINVPSGTPTQFTANTQYGIEVSALGSVNVTGAAVMPPTGNGTVVVSANQGAAGMYIHQTAGATLATNSINGLVAWNNNTDGLRIGAGSAVKVRNSVFGANVRYGVLVAQGNGGTTAQQRDLSTIDLGVGGTSPDYGHNYLQTPTSVLGRNTSTGLCVTLGGAASGGAVLNAAGNFMVYGAGGGMQVDCSTTAQTVTNNAGCGSGASIGITAASLATAVLSQCN